MNKTAITIAYFTLIALGIVGAVTIILLKPDSLGVLVNTLVTILGLGTVAATTFANFGKQNDKLETIEKQTNGTLSKLTNEVTRLQEENKLLLAQAPSTLTGPVDVQRPDSTGE